MLRLVQDFSCVGYSNVTVSICQHEFNNYLLYFLLTTDTSHKRLHVNANERMSTIGDAPLPM